jgi:hypothetical protein
MALLREVEPLDQATRSPMHRFRSRDELEMRDALESWGRARWPGRRVVHELVMDRGTIRADAAFIGVDTFDVFEIKSGYDGVDRLLHQAAGFALASPRVWIFAHGKHRDDVEMVRHLLPQVGLLRWDPMDGGSILLEHEAETRPPHPSALLALCWVAELRAEATRARLWQGKKPPTHKRLVELMKTLSPEEQLAAVCRQLRARQALWRADPPIAAE